MSKLVKTSEVTKIKQNLKYVFQPTELSSMGLDLAREYASCEESQMSLGNGL